MPENNVNNNAPRAEQRDVALAEFVAEQRPVVWLTPSDVEEQIRMLNALRDAYDVNFARIIDLHGSLKVAVAHAADALIFSQESLGLALHKASVEILANIAKRAAVEAAWEYAQALANLAVLNPVGAAAHAAAASEYLAVAALAGGTARAAFTHLPASETSRATVRGVDGERHRSSRTGGFDRGGGGRAENRGPVEININVNGPVDERTLAEAMRRGLDAYQRYFRAA